MYDQREDKRDKRDNEDRKRTKEVDVTQGYYIPMVHRALSLVFLPECLI